MSDDVLRKVPIPVLRRMPQYYYYVKQLLADGETHVSATRVAEHFYFDSITVRKDLALTGAKGKPKKGFVISELIEKIEDLLGWGELDQVVLVGCGDLGSALLGYEGFADYGLEILAAFDNDPDKVGTKIHDKAVLSIDKLTDLCYRMQIKIGIITVPASAAQSVADRLVSGGVRGIWNFTPTALKLPKNVAVQQQSMAGSLAVLVKKIKSKLDEEEQS